MKIPDDPKPYIEFIEDSLAVFGEDWVDGYDAEMVGEGLEERGLDGDMTEWIYDYMSNHPYEIKVIWRDKSTKEMLEELLRDDYPGVEVMSYDRGRFTFSNRVEEPPIDDDDEDEEPEYGYSLYSGTYVTEDDKIRITQVSWGIAPPTN